MGHMIPGEELNPQATPRTMLTQWLLAGWVQNRVRFESVAASAFVLLLGSRMPRECGWRTRGPRGNTSDVRGLTGFGGNNRPAD
jgi:hypothetical protein